MTRRDEHGPAEWVLLAGAAADVTVARARRTGHLEPDVVLEAAECAGNDGCGDGGVCLCVLSCWLCRVALDDAARWVWSMPVRFFAGECSVRFDLCRACADYLAFEIGGENR